MAGEGVGEAKAVLRREMRLRLRAVNAQARAEWSRSIVTAILQHLEAEGFETVMAYAAMPSEVDLDALWSWPGGLVLPRVSGKRLLLHRVDRLESLTPGTLGIREPVSGLEETTLGSVDCVLVPGLAFSPLDGGRLGRGGGFYDRLLEGFGGRRIGVAFGFQLVDEVPCEAHDIRVDALVTEQGLLPVVR